MNAFILKGSSNLPARGHHAHRVKTTVPDVVISQEVENKDFEVCVCVCVRVVILGKGLGNDVCPLSSLWRLCAHLNGSALTLVYVYANTV